MKETSSTEARISPSAIISPKAILGSNVSIGAFSIIHDGVELGDGCIVESYCELGIPTGLAKSSNLKIGPNSHIRSYSAFYSGSSFGEKLITGHRVTVRENTIVGKNFQLGTLSDIQGDCTIGDYVRTHSNVHIGKHSKVGNFVWLFPYIVLTNDPHPPSEVQQGVTVDDYAVIATMSVILPGVRIGSHSLVAAHSCVGKDVEPNTVVGGTPAKVICEASRIKLKDGTQRSAYPWTSHFHRGYPADIVESWVNASKEIHN